MFQTTLTNKNQVNGPKVKIWYGNELQDLQSKKQNFNIRTNDNQKDYKRLQNKLSPRQKTLNFKQQIFFEQISLQDLKLKFNQVINEALEAQYGNSFSQNSSYSHLIDKLKNFENSQELIKSYTQILVSIVKLMEQDRLRSQPKFRTILLNGEQRTKLKLILSDSEEKQLNQFKSKGIESYVKKIEDQCQRHKREYVKVKQRNRIMENQMLKTSLQFKNKRELYITQIARLTQILHSSFMEIGKMFVNPSNPISQLQNHQFFKPQTKQNYSYGQNSQKYKVLVHQSQPNLNRKNVKSLSPKRQVQNYYLKNQMKLLDFIPQLKKSQTALNKDPKTVQLQKNNLNLNENKNQYFSKKNIDGGSQPGKQRNLNVSRNQFAFQSNVIGINKNNDHYRQS